MKLIHRKILCFAMLQSLFGCAANHSSIDEQITCEQHASVAKNLNDWALRNFKETYGDKGDIDGANVQLFLIDEKAPSPYAAAFNRYQERAVGNMKLAKKEGCDTTVYPLSPVDEFRRQVDIARKQK